mgnify:CR=1 FL=1
MSAAHIRGDDDFGGAFPRVRTNAILHFGVQEVERRFFQLRRHDQDIRADAERASLIAGQRLHLCADRNIVGRVQGFAAGMGQLPQAEAAFTRARMP